MALELTAHTTTETEKGLHMPSKIVTRVRNQGGAYVNVVELDTKDQSGRPQCSYACTGCSHDGVPGTKNEAMGDALGHADRCRFEPVEG